MGRKSSYTKEIANEIFHRLSNGEPLTKICRDKHMPGESTVFDWEKSVEGFSDLITRARELSADHFSHEIVEISDEEPTMTIEGDGWTKTQIDHAGIQRNRLRIDTRVKLMQMLKRRSYGEKVQTEVSGELNISLADAISKARKRRDEC